MVWTATQAIRDFLAGKELRMIDFWCAVTPYSSGNRDKSELPEIDEQTWKDLFDACSYLTEGGSMCGIIQRKAPREQKEEGDKENAQ